MDENLIRSRWLKALYVWILSSFVVSVISYGVLFAFEEVKFDGFLFSMIAATLLGQIIAFCSLYYFAYVKNGWKWLAIYMLIIVGPVVTALKDTYEILKNHGNIDNPTNLILTYSLAFVSVYFMIHCERLLKLNRRKKKEAKSISS